MATILALPFELKLMIMKALVDSVRDDDFECSHYRDDDEMRWQIWQFIRGFKWTMVDLRQSAITYTIEQRGATFIDLCKDSQNFSKYRRYLVMCNLEHELSTNHEGAFAEKLRHERTRQTQLQQRQDRRQPRERS